MINVEYVDHMGSDLSIVNAARVSFHKESDWEYCDLDGQGCTDRCEEEAIECPKLPDGDVRLIRFLARNGHWTPFGHTSITVRVKAPVFVRTQCFKHKMGFVENEVSRRYVKEEPEFFVPEEWRAAPTNAKQGSGETLDDSSQINKCYIELLSYFEEFYKDLIKTGVAAEQARMVLPQAMMTEWWWTGSLAAFARVYNLRIDSHAQEEVREVARQIHPIMERLYPVSWKALVTQNAE